MPLTDQLLSANKSKEKLANLEVIRKCMQYLNTAKREGTVRNYEIDLAVEEYLHTQRKRIFELLDEIETYPAGLQKQLFNYKYNYDDE